MMNSSINFTETENNITLNNNISLTTNNNTPKNNEDKHIDDRTWGGFPFDCLAFIIPLLAYIYCIYYANTCRRNKNNVRERRNERRERRNQRRERRNERRNDRRNERRRENRQQNTATNKNKVGFDVKVIKSSNSNCSICLESNSNVCNKSNKFVELECGHQFCQLCITEWSGINLSCPNCRQEI